MNFTNISYPEQEITYHLSTSSSSSSSSSALNTASGIDYSSSIDIDLDTVQDTQTYSTGYAEDSVYKSKDNDLTYLLATGVFKKGMSEILNEHKDVLIRNTEDKLKVNKLSRMLTDTLNKIENFETETAADQRIKLIIYYICEMCLNPAGNNDGLYIVPRPDRLQNQIYETIFIPYMKNLPSDHEHNWEVQKLVQYESKQFGYQAAGKLARLLTMGVRQSFIYF